MPQPWQIEFFRDVALDFWRLAMTPEITATDVEFLARALAITPGARLLDVPCGNGRHAIALAQRGCRVTGIDLAAEYIEEARRAPVDAEFICGDMCDLPWTEAFDGAYCMGNSFCFLDRTAAPQFVRSIARCLKPGGRFAIATEARLDIDYTFIHNGKIETRPVCMYCFTVAELRRMHADAGLETIEMSAWGAEGPYRLGSPGLLMVSRKL